MFCVMSYSRIIVIVNRVEFKSNNSAIEWNQQQEHIATIKMFGIRSNVSNVECESQKKTFENV